MFNKIFKRGKGNVSGIDYLMSSKDASKNFRSHAPVLIRGDVPLTKSIIKNTNFAQRYTSGVLSFQESPGKIDYHTLNQVMSSFENMVSAGIDAERLNWLWVMHVDKKRIELHYVIPNFDLVTGKRFSPYFDRVDRARFRAWERYTNALYHFSDPSDPSRQRNLRLPSTLPKDKVEAINNIHNVIAALVQKSVIKNRGDVIEQLEMAGYKINRKAPEYISIVDQSGRKLRLRGLYYEANFINVSDKYEINTNTFKYNPNEKIEQLKVLRETLEREVNVRMKYIQKRFSSDNQFNNTFELTPRVKKEELNHDRGPESSPAIIEKIRAGNIEARATTDETIQRIESTLTNIEHSATKFRGKLAGIARQFTNFINDSYQFLQPIRRKLHQVKSPDNLKLKY